MPAAIAHLLHAKKVSQKGLGIELDKAAFYWGSQGSDFLFADRFSFFSTFPVLGNRIHSTQVYPCFEKMMSLCRDRESPVLLSYCLGYICHYALDSEAHPFINAWVRRMRNEQTDPENESIVHRRLESAIDAALFERLTFRPVTNFSAYRYFIMDRQKLAPIAQLWSELAREIYGQPVSRERIWQAMLWFRCVLMLADNPSGRRQQKLEKIEAIVKIGPQISSMVPNVGPCGYDCLNILHREWESMATGRTRSDFLQLFSHGVRRGVSLCHQFTHAVSGKGNLDPAAFSLGFDSGCSTLFPD